MREAIDHFENFYAEVFLELAQFGEIEEMQALRVTKQKQKRIVQFDTKIQ